MSDDPREREDAREEDEKEYEAPEAEELPAADTVATGSGLVSPVSDRALKTGFAEVDADDVLAAVRELPITTWSYREDDPRVRHIGPMAQDFAAAFGVGEDDRHIHSVDASGVALAAIQALAARLEAAEARVAELEAAREAGPV